MLYNIKNLLEEVNLTKIEKDNLIQELQDEFPQDEMLFELHLYRTVQFLKNQKKII